MRVESQTTSRRQVLKGAVVLGLGAIAAAGGVVVWRSGARIAPEHRATSVPDERPTLEDLADAVASGGPGKDGIPPIDRPVFVPGGQVDFLADDDPVFGLVYRGEARAYPQMVLVWHEIVNDTVAGKRVAVTYCPLTGTVIGFPGESTFGTTGNLVNSNLLMYDRQTDSEWPQLLGTAIRGPRKGEHLRTVPLVWTSWKAWRTTHPDSHVLSTETGVLRQYGNDPYGSYPRRSGYYFKEGPHFPVWAYDDTIPPKDVVIGIRSGDATVAVHRDLVRRTRSVLVTVGGTPLNVEWDAALDTARVAGAGDTVDALDAMWFAWYAFHPDTEVLR
jgi:hypothetical protein